MTEYVTRHVVMDNDNDQRVRALITELGLKEGSGYSRALNLMLRRVNMRLITDEPLPLVAPVPAEHAAMPSPAHSADSAGLGGDDHEQCHP